MKACRAGGREERKKWYSTNKEIKKRENMGHKE